MRETLDEFAPFFHDGQVGGEIGIKHIIKAQRPERGSHFSYRCFLMAKSKMLCPGGSHGRRDLDDGRDIRIFQRRRNFGGVVTDGQGAGRAVGDALAAKRTVRFGEFPVQAHAYCGAGTAAFHVPDLQRLDLVADFDAAHAFDALRFPADQVAVLRPFIFLHILGIRIVNYIQFCRQILQLAVL